MDLITPELGLFFWTLIAFLIVFFLLKKFAWGPILGTLNDREKSIADSIASAEKVRNEMANMKRENEQLLVQAREERTLMLKEAKETKEKIVSEAKTQASEEANKILAEAREQINNEKMAAMVDLKNHIGKLVLEVSEKVLRKEMSDKSAQTDYINSLTKEIKLN